MGELIKNLPEIIKQSATSTLGILALMIIALAILAFFFFKGAAERTRVHIFVMLLIGVTGFGAVIIRQTKTVSPLQPGPEQQALPRQPSPNPETLEGRKQVYTDFSKTLDAQPGKARLQMRELFTRMWLKKRGLNVSALKRLLNRLGYYKGEIDEVFNLELADAIILFQKDKSLEPVDGICGEMCLTKLEELAYAIAGTRPGQ